MKWKDREKEWDFKLLETNAHTHTHKHTHKRAVELVFVVADSSDWMEL